MSALPNASTEVLKYLFGPPPPKGGGAQPVAKHDQARITMFFTQTPVSGKPSGTRQQQEEPPEAAEAAEPGPEVTRDAGSTSEPGPVAGCVWREGSNSRCCNHWRGGRGGAG
eukprot:357676-Chlamydomonas_euryale.AAC.3